MLAITAGSIPIGAGCSDTAGSGVIDLMVANETEDRVTADIRLERLSDETLVLHEVADIPGDETTKYNDPVRSNGDHRVTVAVQAGPSGSFIWHAVGSNGVHASIQPETVEFAVYQA